MPADENTTLWPGVSNDPLPSRSQANVTAVPSGPAPVALSVTDSPSTTLYGPPASAVGGVLSVFRGEKPTTKSAAMVSGGSLPSWSLTWFASTVSVHDSPLT